VKGGEKMPNLDRFSQGLPDFQEADIVCYCAGCGGEIYEGEEVWEVGKDMIHRRGDCAEMYISEIGFEKEAG
jgi:hypothetical protein